MTATRSKGRGGENSPISPTEHVRPLREQKLERQPQKAAATVLGEVKAIPYGIPGFKRFCGVLRTESGGPFQIHKFEAEMLKPHFDGAIETVIVIPKKNGKTTLLGALALYHLFMVKRAEVVIGASSRDQATYIFRQAEMLVQDPALKDVFVVKGGYRHIRHEEGRIRVLAADADSQDGVIPTLALVDELHRHRTGDLYTVFRKGLTPRDGTMVTISTAGATLSSPLGELRRRFYEYPNFKRTGAHNVIVSPDGTATFHEWCLEDTDDTDDMKLVKTANPAPWHTLKGLRREHDAPSTTDGDWLRFSCGVWTEGENPWLLPSEWDAFRSEEQIEDGENVWIGVDLGVKHDSTGIAIVAKHEDRYICRARIISPTRETPVSLEDVEDTLRRLAQTYRVELIAYDPWRFGRSAEILTDEGYPMHEFPQSPERMSDASARLAYVVGAGLLYHDGDPGLRSHVLAGRTKTTERGWRFVKDAKGSKTDALMALVMAVKVAGEGATMVPTFEVL